MGYKGFLSYYYSSGAILAIAVSCILAYCVNLSTYLVIGHTSPVSYQVLGHFKLLVILAAGILLFHEDANYLRLGGMFLAFAGVVMYTTLKQGIASGWEKPKPHPVAGLLVEDKLPLISPKVFELRGPST